MLIGGAVAAAAAAAVAAAVAAIAAAVLDCGVVLQQGFIVVYLFIYID